VQGTPALKGMATLNLFEKLSQSGETMMVILFIQL
jgi:hypothetical protein